jgi:hypothetical protein
VSEGLCNSRPLGLVMQGIRIERYRLTNVLTALDLQHDIPVEILCARKKWRTIKYCFKEVFRSSYKNFPSDLRKLKLVVQLEGKTSL